METNSKRELFEKMPVPKALATMAIPTIISQLINLIYNVVDTFFIGRTGNSYMMAGVTVSFTLFMLTVAFGNLFGIGGGSLMARLIGQHRDEDAQHVSAFAVYGCVLLSLAYGLFVYVFQTPLLTLLGASLYTMEYAKQYVLLVVVFGSLPTILSAVLAHLLRNVGYSRQASKGLSGGGLLNIILDPLFMFVLLPHGMEVFGAALATLLSNVIACIYLIIVFLRLSGKAPVSLRLSELHKVSGSQIRGLFSVGIPSAILTGLFDVANIFLNAQMAVHGDLQLAAIGIVMKIERLPNAINIGICQGMLPIVAYNFSSGNHTRMNAVIRCARKYGLLICFISMALFEIFGGGVTHIFLDTSGDSATDALATLAFATTFLRIRCLASPVQFLNYSSSYCMQGIGDGRDTMLHAVVRELVFYIPFMFILNRIFGEYGLAGALPVGEACGAAFALFLLTRYIRKHAAVQ